MKTAPAGPGTYLTNRSTGSAEHAASLSGRALIPTGPSLLPRMMARSAWAAGTTMFHSGPTGAGANGGVYGAHR